MSSSFTRMATVTASTKRLATVSSGKRGAAATNISSLKCTPLDPVDEELRVRFSTRASQEIRQCFVQGGLDIVPGDTLVVGSDEYSIRAVGDWWWRPGAADYVRLVLEEVVTT